MTTQTLGVLSVMLSDPTLEWYGLELCRMARIQPGTIYPILDRLLKAQWVTREWEDVDPSAEGRPRRRLYTLTPQGAVLAKDALDRHLRALQEPSGGLTLRPGGARTA